MNKRRQLHNSGVWGQTVRSALMIRHCALYSLTHQKYCPLFTYTPKILPYIHLHIKKYCPLFTYTHPPKIQQLANMDTKHLHLSWYWEACESSIKAELVKQPSILWIIVYDLAQSEEQKTLPWTFQCVNPIWFRCLQCENLDIFFQYKPKSNQI